MISIIIPVYQVERYLPDCLESIIAQTVQDWEAILMDDGSHDRSGVICDSYAQRDERFRVIHQKNAGAANAKNNGLDNARGEYIAFLDSDDTVDSRWLETALSAIGNADVVEYGFDRHYPYGYGSAESWQAAEFGAEDYLEQYLDHWQCSLFWNKLFRAKLLADVRFRKERRCIDDEFFTYKVMTKAEKIVRIPNVLYHYRQRRSSAVNNQKNAMQKTKDSIAIRRERYEWIGNRFPKLRKKYFQRDVEFLYYFANAFQFDNEAIIAYRHLVQFYLKQCLSFWPGVVALRTMLGLLLLSDKKLLREAPAVPILSEEDYFE